MGVYSYCRASPLSILGGLIHSWTLKFQDFLSGVSTETGVVGGWVGVSWFCSQRSYLKRLAFACCTTVSSKGLVGMGGWRKGEDNYK